MKAVSGQTWTLISVRHKRGVLDVIRCGAFLASNGLRQCTAGRFTH
jgi:hypothetical protein